MGWADFYLNILGCFYPDIDRRWLTGGVGRFLFEYSGLHLGFWINLPLPGFWITAVSIVFVRLHGWN